MSRMFFPKENSDLDLFVRFLKITGIWFCRRGGSKYWRWFQNVRMALLISTVAIWDWSMTKVEAASLPKKPYTPVVIWSNVLILIMIYYYSKAGDVEVFVRRLSNLLRKRTRESERNRFTGLTSVAWKYIIAYVSFQATFAVIAIALVSPLCDIVFLLTTDSREPFYIPMALEGFLPEKKRSFVFYALSISNGLMIATPVIYYGALLGLLSGSLVYIYLELEVMKKKLLQWARGKGNQKALLKEIVDDHNEILRLVKLLKNVLGPCFAIENFSAIVVCGFYFYLSKKAVGEGEVMLMASQLYLSFIASLNTFIPCYLGQILSNEGVILYEFIYKLHWYNKPPEMMKDLQMIMIAAAKPMVIDYKSKMALNFTTYSEIMNKAYSLFILLDSLNQL